MLDKTFIFLDTETTGFFPERGDRLLEIACVKIRGLQICKDEVFNMMFNPGRPIPVSATRVNKITDDMVVGKPTIEEKIDEFIEFCRDVDYTLIHNAKFDLGFLNYEFRRLGKDFRLPRVVCTVELSKSLYPQYQAHNLDAIKKRFSLDLRAGEARHRALGDVFLSSEAFIKFYEENPMILLSEIERLVC